MTCSSARTPVSGLSQKMQARGICARIPHYETSRGADGPRHQPQSRVYGDFGTPDSFFARMGRNDKILLLFATHLPSVFRLIKPSFTRIRKSRESVLSASP